jgi:hypothetical protein
MKGTIRIIPPVMDSCCGRTVSSVSCAMLEAISSTDQLRRAARSGAILRGCHAGTNSARCRPCERRDEVVLSHQLSDVGSGRPGSSFRYRQPHHRRN